MKIKRLKKIIVGDHDFDIIWEKDHSGGSFNYEKREIEIGTKNGELRAFGVLIHELKEIIQVEQNTRYERYDEDRSFEFHYTHKEHTQLCSMLAGLLSQFLN